MSKLLENQMKYNFSTFAVDFEKHSKSLVKYTKTVKDLKGHINDFKLEQINAVTDMMKSMTELSISSDNDNLENALKMLAKTIKEMQGSLDETSTDFIGAFNNPVQNTTTPAQAPQTANIQNTPTQQLSSEDINSLRADIILLKGVMDSINRKLIVGSNGGLKVETQM
jgi:hypothetical protein